MRSVAVLGGGIGGLAAAYYLSRCTRAKVLVLEGSSRFGGWLWSCRRSDGAVFELGPRGVRPVGAVGRNTLNLVEELGLEPEILPVTYSHVASQNRFLFVRGQLWKMPGGLGGLLRTTPPFSRPLLPWLLREVFVARGKAEDESLHSFVSRRFSSELADIAVDSLCRGVFAGDCRKLSVRACFPRLHRAERSRGSVLLGMLFGSGSKRDVSPGPLAQRAQRERWAQWSLRRGVEALPEALVHHLEQSSTVELHTQAPARGLERTHSGWTIHTEGGELSADHVVSALPAKALGELLPSSCGPLVSLLQQLPYATVAVVNLEYLGSVLPVQGFGHLLPSSEDPGLLGVVYDSVFFPQHNSPDRESTRLTVMMGGAWFQEVFGDPDQVSPDLLLSRAESAVSRHLGIRQSPVWSNVALHRDCIPQYLLGHAQRVEQMRGFISDARLPLSLVGSSYDGVSVNDVIFSGRIAVEKLLEAQK
ncbi:LOW QUALITY PROTEIN: protoporphyrinogen oxidase [Periophthalmus magnuspinnatus]|uniref:LOW QUALITY PROTEIN: protoporphyrinogen oxidase n=1 Tax=Periophthalmus magnuspinnatus TaxID=409849 RepID=UPI002436AF8B|nr:LOW QUALITY PROTEIN: protoporphyrinogen oxidase [Periophthalmus magnuspinnatus]